MISTKKKLALLAAISAIFATSVFAQQINATTKAQVQITKDQTPASLKRKLKEQLEQKVVKNVLEASFAVKMTPDVEDKIPSLVELLTDSIQISIEPSDGEVIAGSASISVSTAKLKEYLLNKGIGAGDIASKSAKILVSIDEFVGVATNLDGQQATSVEYTYSHDKSTFSDSSAKASGNSASSAASNYASQKDVNAKQSASYSAADSRSSASSGSSQIAVAGQESSAASLATRNGSGAMAASSQMSGSASQQNSAQSKSAHAVAAAESSAYSDKSAVVSANAKASSSAYSQQSRDVQQNNDKVNITYKSTLPEFNNAKPLSAGDRVLASRLSGEFQNNSLTLVAENDLRAENGEITPVYKIVNSGKVDQYVQKITSKGINADVWATGQASYTIVGTTPTGTQCNGNLAVQGRFIEGNEIFFEDALQAQAIGNGDQDCRARLGIALATSLAKVLGERANKELNARSSRGGVYTLYVYSNTALKRSDRRSFNDAIEKIEGIQVSESLNKDNYMAVTVQYAGRLKSTLDKMLDKLPWDNSILLDKGNKICIGVEGAASCPPEFH